MRAAAIALGFLLLTASMFAEDFVALAKHGTLEQIQDAIKAGANANEKDGTGMTALIAAVMDGANPQLMSVFLRNATDYHLVLGVMGDTDPRVISALIKAGAKPNERDMNGVTALMTAAAFNSNSAVISALLKGGASVKERKGDNAVTALMLAAQVNPNPEVIAVLLGAGARVDDQDLFGWTPLMFAAQRNINPEVLAVLLKAGASINYRDKDGLTPLMAAARSNANPAVISLLLDSGADPKLKSDDGTTAFAYAQQNQSLKGTKQLKDLEGAGP